MMSLKRKRVGPEENEPTLSVSGMSSLMRSSVEEDLPKEEAKSANEELMTRRHQGRVLFSQECLMVTPMLAARGKLELTTSTLSFTLSPEFEAEFKQQIDKQTAYIASAKRFEGVNKYLEATRNYQQYDGEDDGEMNMDDYEEVEMEEEKPKSVSLMEARSVPLQVTLRKKTHSTNRMFCGFRSRWTYPSLCSELIPRIISAM